MIRNNVWRIFTSGDAGSLLARRRHERALSQAALAKRVGSSQVRIAQTERAHDLRLSTLLDLANALDLELILVPKERADLVTGILGNEANDDGEDRPRFFLDDDT